MPLLPGLGSFGATDFTQFQLLNPDWGPSIYGNINSHAPGWVLQALDHVKVGGSGSIPRNLDIRAPTGAYNHDGEDETDHPWDMVNAPLYRHPLLALAIVGILTHGAGTTAEMTTLYRAVSEAEYEDLAANQIFRAGPNSIEGGKFFAESAEDAAAWGKELQGPGNFRIIGVEFPKSAADTFMRWQRLDSIGPARYATFDQLQQPFTLHFDF
jgi:hypothetical protein